MFKNVQHYQTTILSCILFVWVYFFGLDISLLEILSVFVTVIVLDYVFLNGLKISKNAVIPYSWVNAAFWICFFLRSEDIAIYIFAWILAICGKYLLTIWWKHFFNPSNMWVFVSLCLFPQYTWVNTLQWGNYSWTAGIEYFIMLAVVIALGIYISTRVTKILHYDYLFTYLIPFFILHSILFFTIPYYESLSSYFLFFNISFFIFTFFMISDPKTIPHKAISRVLYSFIIVLHFYVLQFFINENYSILGSLFVSTILLPIIWYLENNTKPSYVYMFLVSYNILMIIVISICLLLYWQPDLVFDNVCNQLVCK
jgi:hypothetical protein